MTKFNEAQLEFGRINNIDLNPIIVTNVGYAFANNN